MNCIGPKKIIWIINYVQEESLKDVTSKNVILIPQTCPVTITAMCFILIRISAKTVTVKEKVMLSQNYIKYIFT